MKTLKLTLMSLLFGVAVSAASLAAYACADEIYVQDQEDCHMYSRYVLVGSSSGGGVEVCAYEDSGGAKHREDSCGSYIIE